MNTDHLDRTHPFQYTVHYTRDGAEHTFDGAYQQRMTVADIQALQPDGVTVTGIERREVGWPS